MKEIPTVFVVINENGDTEAAFYERSAAIHYCEDAVQIKGYDADEWDFYYRIDVVKVK